MATYNLNTKLIMRNDTPEAWRTTDPILSKGEVGCAINSDKGIVSIKIGDGKHSWNELELRLGTKEKSLEYLGKSTSEAFKAIADAASKAGVSMSEAISALHSIYAFDGNASIDTALQSMQNNTKLQQKQAEHLYKMARSAIEEKQEKQNPYLEDFAIPHYEFEDMDIKNLIDF